MCKMKFHSLIKYLEQSHSKTVCSFEKYSNYNRDKANVLIPLCAYLYVLEHPVLNSEPVKWDPGVNVKRDKQGRIIASQMKS